MISFSREHQIAERLAPKDFPRLPNGVVESLRREGARLTTWQKDHPVLDAVLAGLPVAVLSSLWTLVLVSNPSILTMSLVHGFVAYSWVIYALHECSGHGARSWRAAGSLGAQIRFLIGKSSRLWMADPEHYREFHLPHHSHLGSKEDGSFTHAVGTRRVLKSLLPLAGIAFPNDYKVHMGPQKTDSQKKSLRLGFLFALGLSAVVCFAFQSFSGLWVTLVFGPWVSSVLDRLRESVEHQLMPRDRQYGSREIGWTFLGQVIGGGPWGQPFHFTHHLAPGLPWYLQMRLARHSRHALKTAHSVHPILATSSWKLAAGFVRNQSRIHREEMKMRASDA